MAHDPVDADRERWEELGWPDPDGMAGFTALLRAHKILIDRVHEVLREFDVSITEHAALIFLAMTDGHRQPLNRVAKQLLIGAGRCNYMVNKLEQQGLVKREPHPSDGRTTLAVLTPAGLETSQRCVQALNRLHHGFNTTASDADLRLLRETLARVIDHNAPPAP